MVAHERLLLTILPLQQLSVPPGSCEQLGPPHVPQPGAQHAVPLPPLGFEGIEFNGQPMFAIDVKLRNPLL